MMKKSTRRAFTIVELVIVIAVIAILAAVLIPTFATIIGQANDARAESELREIKIKIESAFSEENPISFTAEVGREVQIGRNTDGSLWQRNATDLADALNSWPELYTFGSFTVSGKDLIYTTKNGTGKATWSNIVGVSPSSPDEGYDYKEPEKPTLVFVDGLEYSKFESRDGYVITGIGELADATEIIIPSEIRGNPVTEIYVLAFQGCTNLKSITIPEGVTLINSAAFFQCTSLEIITIPKSVTIIGPMAFMHCINLKTIEYGGNSDEWSAITFGYNWHTNTKDLTVNCTDNILLNK